ncbi:hypothetical protein [Adhaeretor mobilis]|uniref:PEP-CTERM protein-sorting domain-containing protein n=1 Tax=Adhaeretor mobilis TaxID=1930276 RepID=A0A517MXV0_9BACT|nr:hypothetical protein [Adhaeretor mobilis]QDS99705.1 hypothetical protein HG15A2_30320 [Adhaeretor mobilis]
MRIVASIFSICCLLDGGSPAVAAPFVEYGNHPASYGDHAIAATWSNGPVTSLTVQLETDITVLHADGIGQSQRTARNTLNYVPPSDPDNPQNYDNLQLVAEYGSRLPLLQHLSANGTSSLRYFFGTPITTGFDLFITDVDSSDLARIRAYDADDQLIDMNTWTLAGEGDLSLYKDTGTVFSSITAPTPNTTFSSNRVKLEAVDGTNYNRSYSILRAPSGADVARVSIHFEGVHNSPNREFGGNGSHIYVGLTRTPELPDFDDNDLVDGGDLLAWQLGFDPNGTNAAFGDGDANLDDTVDEHDLRAWQLRYGSPAANVPMASQVPEPTISALLVTGVFLAVGRRRA